MRNRRAFTLVEIMIVVLIIGILLAIAVPNFMKARDNSRTKTCVSNLRQISNGIAQAALDLKLNSSDAVTQAQLVPDYVKAWPSCPAGGTYSLTTVDAPPTCSIGGDHTL